MKQIVTGLHYVTGLMVGRVYVIEDSDGLTVIDQFAFAICKVDGGYERKYPLGQTAG